MVNCMIVSAFKAPYVAPPPQPLVPFYSTCLASPVPVGYSWKRLNERNDSIGLVRRITYFQMSAFAWFEQNPAS